jgi:hypothetical protein
LVWGEELYFDATKVVANASLDSIAPRFYVEEHLGEVFTTIEERPNGEQEDNVSTASERGESPIAVLYELPTVGDNALTEKNSRKRRLDLPRRTPETRAKGRMVSAQCGLSGE